MQRTTKDAESMSPLRVERRFAWLINLARAGVLAAVWCLSVLAASAQAAAVPTNTAPPTISGTAQQGQTLTEHHGTWTGSPSSFSYRWYRCDIHGTQCAAITGATGQTYTLTSADVGHTIVVRERAKNGAGTSQPASSSPTAVVTAPVLGMSFASPPTISGTPQAGQTLTEDHATWSTPPARYSYQWNRCDSSGAGCSAIGGANGQTYTLTAVDAGHAITVLEQAIGSAGQTASAASAATAPVTVATATGLLAAPTAPVVNQQISLIAVVTATVSGTSPLGTVTFRNGGAPVTGCVNEPVSPMGQSATASCGLSLASSTASLTVAFSPAAGSFETASQSAAKTLAVGRDSTSTTLDVSTTAPVGQSTTFTATVAPPASRPGPIQPTGTVEFLDGDQPIATCLSEPVIHGGATCGVAYRQPGNHTIKAVYTGDKNFTGSSSASRSMHIVRPSPTVRGTITATMQWTFHFTRSYTSISALVVNGALHTTVSLECQGRGCPFAKQSTTVRSTRPCHQGTRRTCPTHGTIDLTSRFQNRRLSVGAWFTVKITRSNWIGKSYRFTVQSGKAPRVRLACLAPGGSRPGVGC